jgi:hypothetical protein
VLYTYDIITLGFDKENQYTFLVKLLHIFPK